MPGSPENLVGQRLEVGYWTVHGQEQRLADNIHVIRGFNLEVKELVLSSLASGHMVTTPEERQQGVLAIYVGAGTTDFVLYRDGAPHTTGVVTVGGSHLTNDLAIGLRLTETQGGVDGRHFQVAGDRRGGGAGLRCAGPRGRGAAVGA